MSNRPRRAAKRWGMVAAAAVLCASILATPTPASAQEPTSFRFAGENRYDTAAWISSNVAEVFELCEVVVANGRAFPDGLAGSAFALPMLLTETDALPAETVLALDLITEACIDGGGIETIYVLGGAAAVSEAVFTELSGYTQNIKRLGGANRYETALDIAQEVGVTDTVVLATGQNFPDALAAGPFAGVTPPWPIILNDGDSLRPDVESFLMNSGVTGVWIVGGPAAVPTTIDTQIQQLGIATERLAGANRAATAVAIAEALSPEPYCTVLVNGNDFPDALAAGPFGANLVCPITLVDQDSVPTETNDWLVANAATIEFVFAAGGTAVISGDTLSAAVQAATAP